MTVVHAKPPQDFSFARAPRVMVIESRFYDSIADMLLVGAKKILETSGASYEVFTVPGALEVPAAIKFALSSGYDAYVILGCVIRGETTHYEIVSGESARAIMDLSVQYDLCIGNGILTVENEAQAIDRADPARQDKGGGAALAALNMFQLKQKLMKALN
jgi:6,7-dimethyl-8-ribityllumazine synthase